LVEEAAAAAEAMQEQAHALTGAVAVFTLAQGDRASRPEEGSNATADARRRPGPAKNVVRISRRKPAGTGEQRAAAPGAVAGTVAAATGTDDSWTEF
jgi:hypothetical protein